jgi:hypothetical protein
MIKVENHHGIHVLRDDLLEGGTKSILMPYYDRPEINEFVYASPVYGCFQIALSVYAKSVNKKATIFCAKRKKLHPNTILCKEYGAKIIEIPFGYLSNIEKKARDYCLNKKKIEKITFGGLNQRNIALIGKRMINILKHIKRLPNQIWCAVGSGTLLSGILSSVPNSVKVYGVIVGAEIDMNILNKYHNLTLLKYPKPFEKESKIKINFPSSPNYDRKAFELCLIENENSSIDEYILFWNVM